MNAFLNLILIGILLKDNTEAAILWNYAELGPDYWKIPYYACEGTNQSPIDIKTASTVYDPTLKDFDLTTYNNTQTWTFRNTGYNTGVGTGSENISGFQRDNNVKPVVIGANYSYENTLIQAHIHWGYNDYSGSEHSIDGNNFPLELHLVHSNTNNSNLLMFAFIFQLSETNNTKLNDFVSTIGQVTTATSRKNLTFAIASILPTAEQISSEGYYYYFGSLSLPPCTEGVIWAVFNAKIDISSAQLNVFRQNQFLTNWREPQLLHSRTVYSNKNITTSKTTTSSVKNNLGVLGTIGMIFWNMF